MNVLTGATGNAEHKPPQISPEMTDEVGLIENRFERNDRHREFDGIIRSSHVLVEASDTPVEGLFEMGKMKNYITKIDDLTAQITKLVTPTHEQEHRKYLEQIEQEQQNYVDLCRREAAKKVRRS